MNVHCSALIVNQTKAMRMWTNEAYRIRKQGVRTGTESRSRFMGKGGTLGSGRYRCGRMIGDEMPLVYVFMHTPISLPPVIDMEVINSCLKNNGGCQHMCRHGTGGAVCTCHPGYQLKADGLTCQVKHRDENLTKHLNHIFKKIF